MARTRTVTPDGERIRELRLEAGLTPEQLGSAIGRHPQTIRKLERGAIKNASEILIAQLAKALSVKRADITRHEQNGHERRAPTTAGAA
jgi:transcriptional regulator with XRE-family HTH domain